MAIEDMLRALASGRVVAGPDTAPRVLGRNVQASVAGASVANLVDGDQAGWNIANLVNNVVAGSNVANLVDNIVAGPNLVDVSVRAGAGIPGTYPSPFAPCVGDESIYASLFSSGTTGTASSGIWVPYSEIDHALVEDQAKTFDNDEAALVQLAMSLLSTNLKFLGNNRTDAATAVATEEEAAPSTTGLSAWLRKHAVASEKPYSDPRATFAANIRVACARIEGGIASPYVMPLADSDQIPRGSSGYHEHYGYVGPLVIGRTNTQDPWYRVIYERSPVTGEATLLQAMFGAPPVPDAYTFPVNWPFTRGRGFSDLLDGGFVAPSDLRSLLKKFTTGLDTSPARYIDRRVFLGTFLNALGSQPGTFLIGLLFRDGMANAEKWLTHAAVEGRQLNDVGSDVVRSALDFVDEGGRLWGVVQTILEKWDETIGPMVKTLFYVIEDVVDGVKSFLEAARTAGWIIKEFFTDAEFRSGAADDKYETYFEETELPEIPLGFALDPDFYRSVAFSHQDLCVVAALLRSDIIGAEVEDLDANSELRAALLSDANPGSVATPIIHIDPCMVNFPYEGFDSATVDAGETFRHLLELASLILEQALVVDDAVLALNGVANQGGGMLGAYLSARMTTKDKAGSLLALKEMTGGLTWARVARILWKIYVVDKLVNAEGNTGLDCLYDAVCLSTQRDAVLGPPRSTATTGPTSTQEVNRAHSVKELSIYPYRWFTQGILYRLFGPDNTLADAWCGLPLVDRQAIQTFFAEQNACCVCHYVAVEETGSPPETRIDPDPTPNVGIQLTPENQDDFNNLTEREVLQALDRM